MEQLHLNQRQGHRCFIVGVNFTWIIFTWITFNLLNSYHFLNTNFHVFYSLAHICTAGLLNPSSFVHMHTLYQLLLSCVFSGGKSESYLCNVLSIKEKKNECISIKDIYLLTTYLPIQIESVCQSDDPEEQLPNGAEVYNSINKKCLRKDFLV